MSARYVGKEKFPLRAGGCTLQLRQQRAELYIWSSMPSLNWGWHSGWFYLRNDGVLLPKYTGKMVTEAPKSGRGVLRQRSRRSSLRFLRGFRSCGMPELPWPRWQ